MYKSLSLIPALAAAVVVAQGGNLQPITTAVNPAATPVGCSNCIFVADVTQVIFAEYTTTATATAIISEGQGRNGSTVRTTVLRPGSFSFTRGGGLLSQSPVTGNYVPLTGTVFAVGGATLTSPTAYNVFQSFTLFSLFPSAGSCMTSFQAVSSIATAVSFPIGINDPSTAIFDAQSSFASLVPTLTCAAAGVAPSMLVPVPAIEVTATLSTTSAFRPSPLPQISDSGAVSSTTTTSLSTRTLSSSSTATSRITSAGTSSRIISTSVNANSTSIFTFPGSPRVTQSVITGAAGSIQQPIYFSTALVAGLLALPAMAAFML